MLTLTFAPLSASPDPHIRILETVPGLETVPSPGEPATSSWRDSLEQWTARLSDVKEKNAQLFSVPPQPTVAPQIQPPDAGLSIACPSNQAFELCGLACTRTCSDPEPACSTKCTPRCQCPSHLPIWNGVECATIASCAPPSPPPFGLTEAGCASCGCMVQYGNGILRSNTACRIQPIFNKTRYNCQFAVQTGILYLYGTSWQAADKDTLVDGNVLHTCKEAYPQ